MAPIRSGASAVAYAVVTCCCVALLAACDAIGGDSAEPECPPLEVPADREEGAQALVELVEAHAAFVQAELPGWQLRNAVVPATDGPPSFLYAPSPTKGAVTTYVTQDDSGRWQVRQDDRVSLQEELPILEISDLRLGPETAFEVAEASVPDFDGATAVLMRKDCELRWSVGGFIADREGRPQEVVRGNVSNATSLFEMEERYDFPSGR